MLKLWANFRVLSGCGCAGCEKVTLPSCWRYPEVAATTEHCPAVVVSTFLPASVTDGLEQYLWECTERKFSLFSPICYLSRSAFQILALQLFSAGFFCSMHRLRPYQKKKRLCQSKIIFLVDSYAKPLSLQRFFVHCNFQFICSGKKFKHVQMVSCLDLHQGICCCILKSVPIHK